MSAVSAKPSSSSSGPLRGYGSAPVVVALLIAAVLTLAARKLDLPSLVRAPDAWFYDLRTGMFAPRAEALKDITVIIIDDKSLSQGYISRSPVDRGLEATLVRGVADAGAKAIGLDFIYDHKTTDAADAALLSALRDTRDKLPIVIGELDERSDLIPEAREFQRRFVADSGRTPAHLYFAHDGAKLTVGDQIIRYWLGPAPTPPHRNGLAQALAAAVGKTWDKPIDGPQLIAWQRPPAGSAADQQHPFRVLYVRAHRPGAPISDMLWPGWEAAVKGKIVLIGGGLDDIDRHPTPLSAVSHTTLPGVLVHGYILAQILEGRTVPHTWVVVDLVMLTLAALAGMLVGSRLGWGSGDFRVWFVGFVAVMLAGLLAYASSGLIIPSASLYLAWVAGVWAAASPPWVRKIVSGSVEGAGH